ncbi:methanol O-anthraniloyltransferase-like [Gossypium australe]|uniref:Methanol O-anthraniloyltransferase-like n=1 Tax=Gossypium australe TaxID=47621 RepID=A0A5B6X4A1_9ROSI|nr:methanol O-anthraniloyltransferase-like [Gossypium australe]
MGRKQRRIGPTQTTILYVVNVWIESKGKWSELNPTHEANKGNTNDLHREPSKDDDEPELEPETELEEEQTKEPMITKVNIDASCSTLISRQVPLKLKDPGRFKIPIEYNLTEYWNMYWLRLVILDFEEDDETPILLGRPFLPTSRSTIDLKKNELTMKINSET